MIIKVTYRVVALVVGHTLVVGYFSLYQILKNKIAKLINRKVNRKVEVIYFMILALKLKIVYLIQLRNMKEKVDDN